MISGGVTVGDFFAFTPGDATQRENAEQERTTS